MVRGMKKEGRVSIFVKLFVAVHVTGITVWSLPNPRPAIRNGIVEPYGTDWILFYNWRYVKQSPLRYYLITAGAWQYWDMFSPNPSTIDFYGHAEVVFQDGTVRRHPYPRIYDLPIPVKYFKERFRKFFERAGDNQYQFLWPIFAQRVALEMYDDPENPPVKVRLYRHLQRLWGPGKPIGDYVDELYYEHTVDLQPLRERKGY
jgi:hypothetical protein